MSSPVIKGSSAAFSPAASPADFLAQKHMYQFIQKTALLCLSFYLRFHTLFNLAAQMIKHILIRIFIIYPASLIIQQTAFFLHPLLNFLYDAGIIGFHQFKFLFLHPFPLIQHWIGICSIKRKIFIIIHIEILHFFWWSISVYVIFTVKCLLQFLKNFCKKYDARWFIKIRTHSK